MWKNKFLGGVSFLPLMDKDAEGANGGGDQKTAEQLAQAERDAINVEVSTAKNGDNPGNDTDGGDDGDNADDEQDNEGDGESDGSEEESAEAEGEEETDEQKKERIAREKEERRQSRVQRRIDRLTADAKAAKDEAEALRRQLAETPKEGLSEEDVERRAQELADKKLKDKEAERIAAKFEDDKDTLLKAATKADKEFVENINDAAQEIGLIPSVMIGILSDLDNKNGGDVLAYLAKEDNWELYEEIISLPPVKMGVRLDRLSDKIKGEKQPKVATRPRSRAPEPITPISEGNRNTATTLTGKEDMETFARIRAVQSEAYYKRKNGL